MQIAITSVRTHLFTITAMVISMLMLIVILLLYPFRFIYICVCCVFIVLHCKWTNLPFSVHWTTNRLDDQLVRACSTCQPISSNSNDNYFQLFFSSLNFSLLLYGHLVKIFYDHVWLQLQWLQWLISMTIGPNMGTSVAHLLTCCRCQRIGCYCLCGCYCYCFDDDDNDDCSVLLIFALVLLPPLAPSLIS